MSQKGFRMSTNSSQGLAKAEISETSSINHHSLLRAVMRGSDREKLNIAYLKDLSKLPDTECNPAEMNEAIQSLVRYIKEQEVFGTGISHTLSKSSSVATKAFTEHKEIKTHRDTLVKEQEYLREEILGLAERLKSLEALRDCLGLEEEGVAETTGRKRWKKFQMNKLKSQNKTVQEALIEMGLKEKMTSHKKVEMNDIDVQERHLELIQAQAKSIEHKYFH